MRVAILQLAKQFPIRDPFLVPGFTRPALHKASVAVQNMSAIHRGVLPKKKKRARGAAKFRRKTEGTR